MLGIRGSMTARVHLEGCRVPRANLVARPNLGVSHVAGAALDLGRYTVAWGRVGILDACLAATLDYTSARRQFGQPLRGSAARARPRGVGGRHTSEQATAGGGAAESRKTVKCVVWDLDNTLWDGVLLEDKEMTLRPSVVEVLRVLDERWILHSIASRNDPELALERLQQFGIADYFLYPQIHWGSKSQSVAASAAALNIGLDTIAFVDDQPFEREEVAFSHPVVRCRDGLPSCSVVPHREETSKQLVNCDFAQQAGSEAR